jgi:hypothetical protein
MATRRVLSSKDPTFEAKGPMGIFLCNQTDFGGANAILTPPTDVYGMYIVPTQASLTYGPAGQLPPPWVQGTDWKVPSVPPVYYRLPPFQLATANTYWWSPFGSTCVMSVSNRSSNKVALGAQYVFDQPLTLGSGTLISIHFKILGVAGGSTVLPGFGLWNLVSSPGAWRYFDPVSFDGVYSLQLRTDDFLDYATLSVTYVRYSPLSAGPTMSRLFYSVSGHSRVTFPFPLTASHKIEEVSDPSAQPRQPSSSIDIIRASTKLKEFER